VTPTTTPKAKPKPKPFKPPTVRAKKTPTAPPCYTVKAAPAELTVGEATTLRLQVSGKQKPVPGVKVAVKGAGVLVLSGPTNSAGKVSVNLQPKKPGILNFHTPLHENCSAARVGVAGAFTPPVTG
jgi:hypothetical protein